MYPTSESILLSNRIKHGRKWSARSNIKHIEEIKLQGWEMPSINQIEVSTTTSTARNSLLICITQLHPFCQQKPIVEYCTAEGIVIEAYCPLLRGNMDHPAILELAEKVCGQVDSRGIRLVLMDTTFPCSTIVTQRKYLFAGHCKKGERHELEKSRHLLTDFSRCQCQIRASSKKCDALTHTLKHASVRL